MENFHEPLLPTDCFLWFLTIYDAAILQILKCVNHLSTDPNCLENLQRADAIKYLIPNLELKEGSLVSQIHHEVGILSYVLMVIVGVM